MKLKSNTYNNKTVSLYYDLSKRVYIIELINKNLTTEFKEPKLEKADEIFNMYLEVLNNDNL